MIYFILYSIVAPVIAIGALVLIKRDKMRRGPGYDHKLCEGDFSACAAAGLLWPMALTVLILVEIASHIERLQLGKRFDEQIERIVLWLDKKP